eukprot:TRINITY_DN82896_c0_g1_i1.p1 TRINITY_DN82896_c0_g1~~TRINITY_DN82896_c0_g1_i1.p1  ORF type:complete len:204 (-),score=54.86 TRINITY_DN82896_c0_g1_i1:69-680(-)
MSAFSERLLQRQHGYKRGIEAGDMQRRLRELTAELWRHDHQEKLQSRRDACDVLFEEPSAETFQVDTAGELDAMLLEDLTLQLPRLRQQLWSPGNTAAQLRALQRLRSIWAEASSKVPMSIFGDIPRCLVQLTSAAEMPCEVRTEAMRAIADLACSGDLAQTLAVAEVGALPVCVRLLQSPDEALREEASRALDGVRQSGEIF